MLFVHRSQRAESLAERLAGVLAEPNPDPMAVDTIVVAGRGMERWLSLALAQQLGVCAGVRFRFPARVVRSIVDAALGTLERDAGPDPTPDPWDVDALTWAVLDVLPSLVDTPPFAPLRDYLRRPRADIRYREYGLARRIADLFDRYATFRPDWIERWSAATLGFDADWADTDDAWQPLLWRAIAQRIGRPHPAARIQAAIRALSDAAHPLSGLPPRLCLFGISTLPPAYVGVLIALSSRIPVHLFVPFPSGEWIGDIRDRHQRARDARRHPGTDPADLHDDGHPLLVSLGRQSVEFQAVLTSLAEAAAESGTAILVEHDDFPDPAGGDARPTMLQRVQSDIVLNRTPDRATAADGSAPTRLPTADDTIQFHACHGALRQVEVVRDALLALLAEDPELQARDIAILTPDIETFAPLIDAVFTDGDEPARLARGEPGEAGFPRLMFRIADRSDRVRNPAAEAIQAVLALAAGRLPASAVLDLLDIAPVRARFDLDEDDLGTLHAWVASSGIRWAMDEAHRAGNGLPRDRQNTWRFGLDRMLLGIAMPQEDVRTFADVLPLDTAEGGTTRVVGAFARCCRTLFEACARIQGTTDAAAFTERGQARSLAEWDALVATLLEQFVKLPDRQAWRAGQVREVFARAGAQAGVAFDRPLDLDVARRILEDALGASVSASGLLAGGLNVSALVPMRSLPFRVICLLGMDDRAFPRPDRRPRFDRTSRDRRPGDRSPRDDDRQLFLESLMAARERLILTWTGHDVRDNSPLPPAVPVGELLDLLAATHDLPGRDPDARREALVRHPPLQAFSPRNFLAQAPGGTATGFDRRLLTGAVRLREPKSPPPPFLADMLPEPELPPEGLVVTVEELVRFFENPTRHLLRSRLGIELEDSAPTIEDREPLVPNALEVGRLGGEIVRDLSRGMSPRRIHRRLAGEGRLPAGSPGKQLADDLIRNAQELVATLDGLREGPLGAGRVDLRCGPIRIVGTLADLDDSGPVRVQYGTIQPRHVLGMWVRFLVAAATRPDVPTRAVLVGRRASGSVFRPVETLRLPPDGTATPLAWLSDLATLYPIGLRTPLAFFPGTSFAYFQACMRAEREGKPLDPAPVTTAWEGGFQSRGERVDPWFARVFGDADVVRPDFPTPGVQDVPGITFGELALRIWAPVAACRGERDA